jgi:hypothetical protein
MSVGTTIASWAMALHVCLAYRLRWGYSKAEFLTKKVVESEIVIRRFSCWLQNLVDHQLASYIWSCHVLDMASETSLSGENVDETRVVFVPRQKCDAGDPQQRMRYCAFVIVATHRTNLASELEVLEVMGRLMSATRALGRYRNLLCRTSRAQISFQHRT